jgi:hypothetical protein
MRKLEWVALAAVVGVVVVTQLPRHDHEEMPGDHHAHDTAAIGAHESTASAQPPQGRASSITFAVSGMT